jgi:hypothetical protein
LDGERGLDRQGGIADRVQQFKDMGYRQKGRGRGLAKLAILMLFRRGMPMQGPEDGEETE